MALALGSFEFKIPSYSMAGHPMGLSLDADDVWVLDPSRFPVYRLVDRLHQSFAKITRNTRRVLASETLLG